MSDDLDARLDQPLNLAHVKQRESGRGPKLSYIETHHAIRTANDIFGFGDWGHEIVELRFLGSAPVHGRDGKEGVHVGYLCVIRLTVAGREPTSGVGYGDAVEYRESAIVTAHELAAKEAESDALKRALKNYGDQFGLALYDKEAAKSGHLTNGPVANAKPQPEVESDGKQEAKVARSWAEWNQRLEEMEVFKANDWLKAAAEAAGVTDKKITGDLGQRANRVLLHFADNPPAGLFYTVEETQAGFAKAFDGVVVAKPEGVTA